MSPSFGNTIGGTADAAVAGWKARRIAGRLPRTDLVTGQTLVIMVGTEKSRGSEPHP